MSDKYPRKKSLVDYSKISDRPVQDARFEKAARGPIAPQMPEREAATEAAAPVPRMSTQMDAVMRLMTGREERTIAEKLADSNRPSWEAYKKENEDKLKMDGADEEKMEQYRRELDAQRDKLLARGSGRDNTGKKRKKKKKRRRHESSDSDSSSESSGSEDSQDYRRRKKHRKKHKKKRRHHRRDDDSESEDTCSDRKRRKKHSKKRKKREQSGEESDGSHYKLSRFFAEGTENNS